jgi:NAD(P)-dependent dehydrogenase (short-subunit alcohol dehydrogenase family)
VPVTPDLAALSGRVALVTGAARGIGRATAVALAAFGADLLICDRDTNGLAETAEEIRGLSRHSSSAILDVRDNAAVTNWTAGIERVDILVNNAGGTFFAPFLAVNDKGEEALIHENFTQLTRLTRAVVPLMTAGGSIVNVTSIEAHQAAPGFAVYAAMKAAVAQLTRTLALELAPHAIRVNAVAPDAIPTSGDEVIRTSLLTAGAGYDPSFVPPLGWLGVPDDAAAAVVWLAGDLSRFVTGTTVHVDGGNWAAGGWRRIDP